MRWFVLLVALTWPSPATADMALPKPGVNTVRCDVEIEVPADLNGCRLFLFAWRGPPRELAAGATFRMSDHNDERDAEGLLVALPAKQVAALGDLENVKPSAEDGHVIQLWVDLHFLDLRRKPLAQYRIESVSPEGRIVLTALHVDGGWTGSLCAATCVLPFLCIVAWIMWAIVRGGAWPKTTTPPTAN